jgi:hypothetical protein
MSFENPFWGATKIHGELLKLGIQVAQSKQGSTSRAFATMTRASSRRRRRSSGSPRRRSLAGAVSGFGFAVGDNGDEMRGVAYLTFRFIADSLPRLLSISY